MDHEIAAKTIVAGNRIVSIEVLRIPYGWRFTARTWGRRSEKPLLSVSSRDLMGGLEYTQRRVQEELGGYP